MSHNIGRFVAVANTRVGPDSGQMTLNFVPQPLSNGLPPLFVILHLTDLVLPSGARVEVELGYAQDVFTSASGVDVWSRPIDPALGPVVIRYVGSGPTGGATLSEYGSGEPFHTHYETGQEAHESTTNADVFLHDATYAEPEYHSTFRCGPTLDWQNAACADADAIKHETARATGIIVAGHFHFDGQRLLSSCSATLIDTNLILTARHCADDVNNLEILSGSVTFDFQTSCGGTRPAGYAPFFHKIRGVRAQGAPPTMWSAETTDWLILEIDPPPTGIVPRPLRATAPIVGEPVFAVHHPNGAVKKIQSAPLDSGDIHAVNTLDFAGGSSGSSLFDSQGHVLGAALSIGPSCAVGYNSVSGIITSLANPPVPAVPFDVMMVLDRSGSMAEPGTSGPNRTKLIEAKEAASLFVQLVREGDGDRLGMVSFSSSASSPVDEAPGLVNQGQKNQLVGPQSPYTGGDVGDIMAGGSTSIGGGLQAAMQALGSTGNTRAILLMTDGMQNTPPMVQDVESSLGDTRIYIVGFGSESNLDSALLNQLARAHGGFYTRANDGLNLKKFFGMCFGDIFESGSLVDPEGVLPTGESESKPLHFDVCDEDHITAIIGWEDPSDDLEVMLVTPGGRTLDPSTSGVVHRRGPTWSFMRTDLPIDGERAGKWSASLHRRGRDEKRLPEIRYFLSIVADGGPKLTPLLPRGRRFYTGDSLNPRVGLHYAYGVAPRAAITLSIERPDAALGELVLRSKLSPASLGEEPVGSFRATLRDLEASHGGKLPLPYKRESIQLLDDGNHDDGGLEPDGIYGAPLTEALIHEGTYEFHAVATYGTTCPGRRETTWSVEVQLGIDGESSDIRLVDTRRVGSRTVGALRLVPRDRYGNRLGPGRADHFTVDGSAGTVVTGASVVDNSDGSYDISTSWPSDAEPALVVSQPGRTPVTVTPILSRRRCPRWLCWGLAVLSAVLFVVILILVL